MTETRIVVRRPPLALRALVAFAATAAGCAPEPAPVSESDELVGLEPSGVAACKKNVFLHIANFSWFEEPANSGIPLNGCWGYDMFQRWQHEWAHFKYTDTVMKSPGSEANANANRRWVYNETAFSHKSPNDSQKIDKGRSRFADTWGVPASVSGYEYLMYQGWEGWKKSGNPNVARSFAELYGPGNWWPFWAQWKAHPIGRPMAAIPDADYGYRTYWVIKGLCDYVADSTFIGVDVEIPVAKGSPALDNLVYAMNACTGG